MSRPSRQLPRAMGSSEIIILRKVQRPSLCNIMPDQVRGRKAFEQQGLGGHPQAQHYRRAALRHRGAPLVLRGLGRSKRGRRALLHGGRRPARQDPHSGNCRQPVFRRSATKQTLYLRLDIALCGLYQRTGRHEAVTSFVETISAYIC